MSLFDYLDSLDRKGAEVLVEKVAKMVASKEGRLVSRLSDKTRIK